MVEGRVELGLAIPARPEVVLAGTRRRATSDGEESCGGGAGPRFERSAKRNR